MRVAEIAELTGTTVRTVRYYHSLGLLPVPPVRGGWRDYELTHVARLSRIRWLVQAGVPLGSIARILDADARAPAEPAVSGRSSADAADSPAATSSDRHADSNNSNNSDNSGDGGGDENRESTDGACRDGKRDRVAVDLAGALKAVEKHLADTARQRDMLVALLERAREGLTVSPMPTRMVVFFDRLEAAAPDEHTRAAVRRERDVIDLACYRGQMPAEAEFLFFDPQPENDASILEAYGQDASALSDEQVGERADVNVRRIETVLRPERLRALARSVDKEAVRSFFRLASRVEPFDARLGAAMERRLLEAIDRWSKAE
ncbi:MerR family transcriptional regulator [Actinomyces oricola]